MGGISDCFALADWYKALTLQERAAGLPTEGGGILSSSDSERAARRLERWRTQRPFSEDGFFGRRLAADGLTPDDLRNLLGETSDALAARAGRRPEWLAELARAFSAQSGDPFPLSAELLDGNRQAGFLEAVRPLLDAGWERLGAGLATLALSHPCPCFDPAAVRFLLARNLPPHLLYIVSRTFVLELFLAGKEERLTGETPEERFASFTAGLADRETALALLLQYPVLARQVTETIGRWERYSLEILTHLAGDEERLRAMFAPDGGLGGSLGTLTEIRANLGDTHRDGRSVAFLRFDSGLALVYKPRSLGAEAGFQDLLDWTAAKGFEPAFRRLRVLEGGDYGWVEFAAAAPCATAAEVERFYLRQGGYLALLFALSATDMHHENLIAAGEHPILVDLEALFHPQDKALNRQAPGVPLPDTVLRIGFLPALNWGGQDTEGGVDLSGLAANDGQVLQQPVLQIEGSGTDQMRFLRRPLTIPVGEHRPTLNGAAVAVTDYSDTVALGFNRMIRLLARHRGELLAAAGPLAAFATAPVRVIVRPSMAYAGLLLEGQHPFVLGDALERDRLLDRLWTAATDFPAIERLLPAERRDIGRGDIPVFTTLPGSLDLRASDGEIISGILHETGLERVQERLRDLDEGEIERQTWMVRSALDVLLSKEGISPGELRERETAPSRAELLEAAVAIGRRLEALAFRRGGGALWFIPNVRGRNERFMLTPAGPDVHLGVPGIALFLAQLGAVTGEAAFTDLARAAMVTLRGQIDHASELVTSVGAFSGWGGILYTLTHLGVLWQDDSLLDEAVRIASALGPQIDADEVCDVVGGSAGCLVALLRLSDVRPSGELLDLAVRCGERILARAVRQERGIGWVYKLAGPTPLAGFSHGAAGVSWALLHLHAACGDDRFRAAALKALEYERSLYAPAEANWPDLRARDGETPEHEPHFMCAWCHGAAGIALARLDSLRFLDDSTLREEAATAVATTLATGFGQGHCLCHGDFGNLEPLLLAAEVLGTPGLTDRIGHLAGGLLDSLLRGGPRFGVGKAEVPGLMLGLAGVGYGLLRLAEPRRVPAVLRLAPPNLDRQ